MGKFLLILVLVFLFFIVYGIISVKRLIERGHNTAFEPREESEVSKMYNKSKVDKSKAEDVNFEEVKEDK